MARTEITTPDFTFTAESPGLDIEAIASAEITSPADIKAAAELRVTNLGHTVTGALNGTTLNITSTPKTEEFLLNAAGAVNIDVDLGFELLAGSSRTSATSSIDIDIKKLTLGFKQASTLQLDLGITTGLKGDYEQFTFGEDTKTVGDDRRRAEPASPTCRSADPRPRPRDPHRQRGHRLRQRDRPVPDGVQHRRTWCSPRP